MMAMIMRARDPEVLDRASDLGIAFQLTNIARDVVDDARMGRVYLPATLLRRHEVTRIAPDDPEQRRRLYGAAIDLLDIAEKYYASAYAGMSALPWRSAWAIAAARRVYRAIGSRLRAGGPSAWDRRVSTSRQEKLQLLAIALSDVAATRFKGSAPPRDGLWNRPGR